MLRGWEDEWSKQGEDLEKVLEGDDGQRVRLEEKRKKMREYMEHLKRGRRRLLSSAMKASVASKHAVYVYEHAGPENKKQLGNLQINKDKNCYLCVFSQPYSVCATVAPHLCSRNNHELSCKEILEKNSRFD